MEEILKWQELDSQLSLFFTPGTAINRRAFFQGRIAALRTLIDAVNQRGQHVAIYGERGVGKTSLANVLVAALEPFTGRQIFSYRANCHRGSTYASIWTEFLQALGIVESNGYQWGFGAIDVGFERVIQELGQRDQKLILIADEFDRIEDPDVPGQFADTIKALSDYDIDTTLVVVGVADEVDELITEHESIDRCLVQVLVPRMPIDELGRIVEYGIDSAGMSIGRDAVAHISTLTLGLPLPRPRAWAAAESRSTHTEHMWRWET